MRYNNMGLPDELYDAMLGVGYAAKRHKVPMLPTMIDSARKLLPIWHEDERTMVRFAAILLAGPTNLRATTGQLPAPVADACWRLLELLEYITCLHDGQ
jgi:hypothetical protein